MDNTKWWKYPIHKPKRIPELDKIILTAEEEYVKLRVLSRFQFCNGFIDGYYGGDKK